MLEDALRLAASGWGVFPCWERDHREKIDPETGEITLEGSKAPRIRRGFHAATTDPDQIRRWWTTWPAAMIGAPVPIGLVVLDIDPRNGGSLDALEDVLGPLPQTVTAWSGRGDGGRHLYFRVHPDLTLTGRSLPQGIDLKPGGKGYCIVPPSVHPATGQPYRWEGNDLAVLPAEPVRALQRIPRPPKPYRLILSGPGGGAGLVRTVAEAVDGNRNRALFWSARSAAEDGILDQIRAELVDAARSAGLTELEAQRTIDSAARAVTA